MGTNSTSVEKAARLLDRSEVAVTLTGMSEYPERVPFDPPVRYPEYEGRGIDPKNQLYDWVRTTLPICVLLSRR